MLPILPSKTMLPIPVQKKCILLLSDFHQELSSDSSARESEGGFPQALHVAHGWDTEEAFVLPVEVGGVVVAHAVGGTGRVEVFAQHQPAGLQGPQPLLELQGAQLACEALDAQGLVEVLTESFDRSGDGGGVAFQG